MGKEVSAGRIPLGRLWPLDFTWLPIIVAALPRRASVRLFYLRGNVIGINLRVTLSAIFLRWLKSCCTRRSKCWKASF